MNWSPALRDPALRSRSTDTHILVVDDDPRLLQLLKRYIRSAGYRVTGAGDAGQARTLLTMLRFDLILLDVMLPGESGLALTAEIQRSLRTPVLLLSALGEADNRIAGLAVGADDYLGKPFEPKELLLRIRSILRRAAEAPNADAEPGVLRFGSIQFDPARAEFHGSSGEVTLLSGSEAALMRVFARHPGEVLSRPVLLAELREGLGNGQDRMIDVRITRLRRKLEPDPAHPRYLRTIRGAGYVLVPDSPESPATEQLEEQGP